MEDLMSFMNREILLLLYNIQFGNLTNLTSILQFVKLYNKLDQLFHFLFKEFQPIQNNCQLCSAI